MRRPNLHSIPCAALAACGLMLLSTGCSHANVAAAAATPPTPEYHDLAAFYQSLPAAENPPLSEVQAATLAVYPLNCLDRLQPAGRGGAAAAAADAAPGGGATAATGTAAGGTSEAAASPATTAYLWVPQNTTTLLTGYANQRAFFGCNDWHSAVASTWTLVAALRRYPNSAMAKLIRERLNDHLAKRNLDGEAAYLATARTFERPYGQAWAMKLYTELDGWTDPDAVKWEAGLKPIVTQFAAAMPTYLNDMPDAIRQGTTANTANVLYLMMGYADNAHDTALRTAIDANAKRLFLNDEDCPTAYEADPGSSVSPCLAEAALMSQVLDHAAYATWLTNFLPPLYGRAFRFVTTSATPEEIAKMATNANKGNAIGLSFERAAAYVEIAAALPLQDARAAFFRRLAALQAGAGYKALAANSMAAPQWIPAFAMMYETELAPVAAPKPAEVKAATP